MTGDRVPIPDFDFRARMIERAGFERRAFVSPDGRRRAEFAAVAERDGVVECVLTVDGRTVGGSYEPGIAWSADGRRAALVEVVGWCEAGGFGHFNPVLAVALLDPDAGRVARIEENSHGWTPPAFDESGALVYAPIVDDGRGARRVPRADWPGDDV